MAYLCYGGISAAKGHVAGAELPLALRDPPSERENSGVGACPRPSLLATSTQPCGSHYNSPPRSVTVSTSSIHKTMELFKELIS